MLNGDESSPNLQPDQPQVFENIHKRHCWVFNSEIPTFTSTTSVITVIWHPGKNTKNREGFRLHWNVNTPSCGEELQVFGKGNLQSPNFPMLEGNQYCHWRRVETIKKIFEKISCSFSSKLNQMKIRVLSF